MIRGTAVLLIGLLMSGAASAHAASERVIPKIGYVDILEVEMKAEPVKTMIEKADNSLEPAIEQYEVKLKKFDQLRDELRNESLVSQERKDQIARELETLQLELADDEGKIRRRMDNATNKAIVEVGDMIIEAIEEVAKEQGYTIIVSKSQIIYGVENADITDAVIRKLNETRQGAGTETQSFQPRELKDPAAAD